MQVAIHCFSNDLWLWVGWSKSRLAKAAGAEPAGQMRDEKLHTLVARAHFQVKMYKARKLQTSLEVAMSKKCTQLWRAAHFQVKSVKNWRVGGTFGSWDVEKVNPVVARSAFPCEHVKSTTCSDRFWTSKWRKSAHRCGAEHIWKSKVSKTAGSESFLTSDVEKMHTN